MGVEPFCDGPDLLNAVRFVIDRHEDRQIGAEACQQLERGYAVEVIEKDIRRGRAAIDYGQVRCVQGGKHAVEFALLSNIEELRFGMKTLQG